MKTTVTGCDCCKRVSQHARADGWIIVRDNGIEKMSEAALDKEYVKEFGTTGMDFCSWRCFKKFFRGKK